MLIPSQQPNKQQIAAHLLLGRDPMLCTAFQLTFPLLCVPLPDSALCRGREKCCFTVKHIGSCHLCLKSQRYHGVPPHTFCFPMVSTFCNDFISQADLGPFRLLHPEIISRRKDQGPFSWVVKPGQDSLFLFLSLCNGLGPLA